MSNLQSFAYQIKQAYDNQDSQLFSQLITVEITSPTVLTLSQELLHVTMEQNNCTSRKKVTHFQLDT
jgi:hypothetical protein